MEKKLWFKRKRYGYGWIPASLEGWLATLIYITLFTLAEVIFINNVEEHHSRLDISILISIQVVLTAGLIYVCYKKGEKPRWSWGGDKKDTTLPEEKK